MSAPSEAYFCPRMERVNIAFFASGTGTNVASILQELRSFPEFVPALLVSDRKDAGVLRIAEEKNVPARALSKEEVKDGRSLCELLHEHQVHLIVLAGYFKKIPPEVIEAYRDRILNVHPALLPDFGGKGMYGLNVHRAVLEAGRDKSGITIHRVDEEYDHGPPLLQKECPVRKDDTPESLAERIKELEHEHYPQVVVQEASKLLKQG